MGPVVLMWVPWAHLVLPKNNEASNRGIWARGSYWATQRYKCRCYRTLERDNLGEQPLLCFAGIFFAGSTHLSSIGQYWADALTTKYSGGGLVRPILWVFQGGLWPALLMGIAGSRPEEERLRCFFAFWRAGVGGAVRRTVGGVFIELLATQCAVRRV